MLIEKIGEISAVGFDIDGTLYKSWKLNVRVVPHILGNLKFYRNYSKARKIMHEMHTESREQFYEIQNKVLGVLLNCTPEKAGKLETKIADRGLSRFFKRIKPCDGAIELMKDLKAAGLKLALLSDFSPDQKGDVWGVRPYCDVALGTADCGALKPSVLPFKKMAEDLGVPKEKILFVGNSLSLDIVGAKNAGMKTAWFTAKNKCNNEKHPEVDFCFWDYAQLRELLLPGTAK